MTYWGAVAAGQPDSTVLSMIAKSERGVCELTMAVLEDWVVLDTLGGEFETRQIVYQEDFEKAPPGMPVLPTAAGSVEEGHLGCGAADQPATGVANMRRRPAAGDHILQVFSCGEIIAKPSTSAERKRGHFHNVRRGVKELQAMEGSNAWIMIDGCEVPGNLQEVHSSRVLIMEQNRVVLGFASTAPMAHIVAQGQLDDNEGRDTPITGMRFLILLSNILALLGATVMQFDFAQAEAICAIYARDGDDRVQQTPHLEAQVAHIAGVLVAVKQEIAMRELCEGERRLQVWRPELWELGGQYTAGMDRQVTIRDGLAGDDAGSRRCEFTTFRGTKVHAANRGRNDVERMIGGANDSNTVDEDRPRHLEVSSALRTLRLHTMKEGKSTEETNAAHGGGDFDGTTLVLSGAADTARFNDKGGSNDGGYGPSR
jgi:hypothetical protein